MRNLIKKMRIKLNYLIALGVTIMANPAMATAISNTDDFYDFYSAVNGWAGSGLGVGLSITALLVGAGAGIYASKATPALIGVALACIIAWGPAIILRIVTGGALI